MTALFDVEPPARPATSKTYSDAVGPASYAAVKLKEPPPCDECVAVQHETRGESGHRRVAKIRRTQPGRPSVMLCSPHAEEWKQRDG